MTIEEMHYDFKMKFNKIDSQQYRNLRIPEIDWLLNEAQEILVKNIAFPRVINHLGFETTQRTIDDIRTIVIEDISLNKIRDTTVFELPEDYMFYVSAKAVLNKPECGTKEVQIIIRQHDDKFQESPFDISSFEWGDINATFDSRGIRIYTDETFNIEELKLTYIKKPAYIHNAVNFLPATQYSLPNGDLLTGKQDSELPIQMHREIVDIAVLLASNNLDSQNFQLKQYKLNLNQLN